MFMETNFINSELQNLADNISNKEELLLAIDLLISKQKKETETLRENFDRLNVIIDLIPNTISWVNRDMTYFGVNRALANTCGIAPEEFVGKTIGFHTREQFFNDFVSELFNSSNNTIYRDLESKIGEKTHTFLVSGTKLQDKDKAVIIGVDITELTLLKGHISFTEKLATLGEMFAGIIHDINNPLMTIEGNVKRIKKKIVDDEVTLLLNKIEMSSQKISKIVQGIKVYIRQDGDQPYKIEEIGLILEDATIICENKLKDHEITLRIDPRLKNIKLNCHFTQMFQVFVNLISNSIDAISNLSEKWIEINLIEENKESGLITIQVIDSGNGIPKDLQEKIFNAFYTTKERGVGSGLGLSLCKKILETHGGKLFIDDDQPHTTFILELKKYQI
jgi:C4-dicarboxylate-specific signal transduction histidine kinase